MRCGRRDRAWARAGSRCSTTRPAWCRRPGGTRGSCSWSPAGSARPASSGPAKSPQTLAAIQAGGGSDRDLELILVRARGSTGGQKCALPTGESLLIQSLVQGFQAEFGSHVGRSCPLPRELPFHKLIDWDATAARFTYDLAYAHKQPDWTSPS
jgi:hypothetical protein